ncbi:MAG: D-alanyl-D-alanine carboxypeptidase [Ruminococcaceae bacterium]|nr:D-alanyl-D-alanine carboxypeptidase [Oscillospiraceae bacterium]
MLSPMQVFALENEIQAVDQDTEVTLSFPCKSALLMEASTGKVLFEQNADEALPPASVTKVMTLLLVMEAIADGRLHYEDAVTTSAHACSMGGSQIYLKEGEQMSVEDMLKSVVIASANDAAVALAEHIAGTEEAFVAQMNRRAAELGMQNTHFENTNGLDDTTSEHLTSARDIAIMSRALLSHEKIKEYSSIWMDTIRDGAFGLTNTNRLVRFYRGATGLKTGSTAKAGFCVSASATREGMELICVIMGAESRDIRNASATALLDWGFSNYAVYCAPKVTLEPIRVLGGVRAECCVATEDFRDVMSKNDAKRMQYVTEVPKTLSAPVQKGDVIGKVTYQLDGKTVGEARILADESVEKIGFGELLLRVLARMSAV